MTPREVGMSQDRSTAVSGTEDRLGRLFRELYAGADGTPLEDGQLEEHLLRCATRAELDQVIASADLRSRQRGLLTLGQQVLDDYFSQPAFHPELSRRLRDASGAMLALLLSDDGWLSGHKHPFYSLLQRVAELAQGWHPGHAQAEDIACRMVEWFRRAGGGEPVERVMAVAVKWSKRFRARTAKLEQRLRDREEGTLRLQYARREAARVINRQLAGRELPVSVARDLQEIWLPGLQWVLLNESAGSGTWNHAVRVLTLLFWSVQPPQDSEQARDKRRRVAADVKKALPGLLERILPEPGLSERILEELQIIWLSLDHDRPLDFAAVPPLNSGSLMDDAGASVSRDLLDEIAGVSDRDWFEEKASGRRLRLLMKHDQYQELMFVDQAGFKAASISFEDFAWQLTNGSVAPLSRPCSPAELVAERLNMLAQRFREKRRVAPVCSPPLPAGKPKKVAGQSTVSAHDLRKAARRRQQEALGEQVSSLAEDPRRQKWARLLVSGLTLGTWLTVERDGRFLQRKLILILSSSDKYVLVGADGTGRLELSRAELIGGVADGSISISSDDSRYNDTLGRVLEGLQRRQADC